MDLTIRQKAVLSTTPTSQSIIGEFVLTLDIQGLNVPTTLIRTVKFSATQNLADSKISDCVAMGSGGSSSSANSNPLADTIIINKADTASTTAATAALISATDKVGAAALQYCRDWESNFNFAPDKCNTTTFFNTVNGFVNPASYVSLWTGSTGGLPGGVTIPGSFLAALDTSLGLAACAGNATCKTDIYRNISASANIPPLTNPFSTSKVISWTRPYLAPHQP